MGIEPEFFDFTARIIVSSTMQYPSLANLYFHSAQVKFSLI